MQWVTLCSCLKQVTESLLLVSGCSERVGGVWHKRGFQLAEPGTDGAGKWGTSQKHWNPPPMTLPTLLSLLHTHSVFPSRSLFPPWMSHFLCQDYGYLLLLTQVPWFKKKPLLNMDNGMRISDIFSLIVGTQGALGHLPVWVFVHLDGASRWQGWVWASPGNGCRQPRNKSHFLKHSLSVHL